MNGLVSVVIPTYNRRHLVAEAIESVLAQTYRPLEVIVVDDGSTDGTESDLQRFQDQIRYLIQPNRGPSAARNRGIRAATGEYVALLDSDDLWAPAKLEKQVAVMAGAPRVGVVFCEVERLDVRSGVRERLHCLPDARGDLRRTLLYRNRVMGSDSAVLVRRACFEQAGLFDEALQSAEDWDLWIRISRHYHFDHVKEALVTLRIHGGNLHQNVRLMHEHQLEVIRRAFRDDPIDGENRLLLRRSLGYIHYDAGSEYLLAGQYRAGLRHLLHSLALWPFDLSCQLHLLRALLKPLKSALRRPAPAPSETAGYDSATSAFAE